MSKYYDLQTGIINSDGIEFIKNHLLSVHVSCCAGGIQRVVTQLFCLRRAEAGGRNEARFVLVMCENCYVTRLYNANEMGLDAE